MLCREMTTALLAAVPTATLSLLDGLRAEGTRLGLVCNTTAESPDAFRRSPLAARLDTTALSSELGVAKPDPALYLAACDALRVRPQDCIYVGDGADGELAAARGLGMFAVRTVEFADTGPYWDGPVIGVLADLALCCQPDTPRGPAPPVAGARRCGIVTADSRLLTSKDLRCHRRPHTLSDTTNTRSVCSPAATGIRLPPGRGHHTVRLLRIRPSNLDHTKGSEPCAEGSS